MNHETVLLEELTYWEQATLEAYRLGHETRAKECRRISVAIVHELNEER